MSSAEAFKKLTIVALAICLGSMAMANAAPVTVTGRVVDKTGSPISGAEVRIGRWGDLWIGEPVTTGQDGRFVYAGVEPLAGCVASGILSTTLENAYIARVRVVNDVWPEIPLCIEPVPGSATIDKGNLSRGHFLWANHHFHLFRNTTDDYAAGNQNFFASWQIGVGNDRGGPIDWEIDVTVAPGLEGVFRTFPAPDPDWPNFNWSGTLPADQDFNYTAVGLVDSVPFPTPEPLGFEVTRLSDSLIPAHSTVTRSFILSVTTIDPRVQSLYGQVQPYHTPSGPVSVGGFTCVPDQLNGIVNIGGQAGAQFADWSVLGGDPPGHGTLVPGTYRLTCTITLSNSGDSPAVYKPWATIQAMQEQFSSRYLAVSTLTVTSPDVQVEPRDRLGLSTYTVKEAGGNPGVGLFDVGFSRTLIRRIVFMSENQESAVPLAPPTLTASPLTAVASPTAFTISGTGVPGATVYLLDGGIQVTAGIPVNSAGTWSIVRYWIVGSHVLTATQAMGRQISAASPPITIHVLPPAPRITGPALVVVQTSPAPVTLTGTGFYGFAQTPPTGSIVTIFGDDGLALGAATVGDNGQWSAPVSLAWGPHSLTARQKLAGETSPLSPPFTIMIQKPVVTNKDQCKKDGWMGLSRADGTWFKNQGDCVSYANNGK